MLEAMNDDELTELERLANAATPGPWKCSRRVVYDSEHELIASTSRNSSHNQQGVEANTAFIAAARDAVPKLCSLIRENLATSDENLEFYMSRMRTMVSEVREARARLALLEPVVAAAKELVELAEEMLPYVPDYHRKKWGHREELDRCRQPVDALLSHEQSESAAEKAGEPWRCSKQRTKRR